MAPFVCTGAVNLVVTLLYCDRGALRSFANKTTLCIIREYLIRDLHILYSLSSSQSRSSLEWLREEGKGQIHQRGRLPRGIRRGGRGPLTLDPGSYIHMYTPLRKMSICSGPALEAGTSSL